MGDWSVNFKLFEEKIMFKSHQIKSKHRVLSKKEDDSYGAPVFARATVLAAKMCPNSNDHSMYDFF
jgi:hypothetical protein